jgi:hypothetical protein
MRDRRDATAVPRSNLLAFGADTSENFGDGAETAFMTRSLPIGHHGSVELPPEIACYSTHEGASGEASRHCIREPAAHCLPPVDVFSRLRKSIDANPRFRLQTAAN